MFKQYIKPTFEQKIFTSRGDGSSRLESLCDGIFALAIAMLLISTSVPSNFSELSLFVSDLIPFGICTLFIFWIWKQHVIFFQRYGLTEENAIVRWSYFLLMLVLFFVYALKFLMTWIVQFFSGAFWAFWFKTPLYEQIKGPLAMVNNEEMPWLMLIYSLSFLGIFGMFTLMYRYVLRHKEALELSPQESIITQASYYHQLSSIGAAGISMLFALFGIATNWPWAGFFSGMSFNLLWISGRFVAKWQKKQLAALEDA